MHELRKKMFLSLFCLLSALAAALSILMLSMDYSDTASRVQSDLVSLNKTMESLYDLYRNPFQGKDQDPQWWDEKRILTELPSYTVFFNRDEPNVENMFVLYHNSDDEAADQIKLLALKIISRSKAGDMHIGNLFTDKYAWYFASNSVVSIVNVRSLQIKLYWAICTALLILGLFEFILYFVCRRLTKWMIEPIEKAFEKQRQFVADASHELKTPVAVILASAEAMEKDGNPKWLGNIEEEAGRMNGLITDLLDLTRSEQNQAVLECVSLSAAAAKQCAIQEAVMFEKNILLEEDIEQGVFVKASKAQLVQVIAILLDNAISHSTGTIRVTLKTQGQKALFSVANTGKEIPPEEREKIFERFYRADDSRNRNSNRYGLGLAIAKNICEGFKGSIGVDCGSGRTVFRVILPLCAAPVQEKPALPQK